MNVPKRLDAYGSENTQKISNSGTRCLIGVGKRKNISSETVSLCIASRLTNKHTTSWKQMVLTSLRRLARCSTLLSTPCSSRISDDGCNGLLAPIRALAEFWPPSATVDVEPVVSLPS